MQIYLAGSKLILVYNKIKHTFFAYVNELSNTHTEKKAKDEKYKRNLNRTKFECISVGRLRNRFVQWDVTLPSLGWGEQTSGHYSFTFSATKTKCQIFFFLNYN